MSFSESIPKISIVVPCYNQVDSLRETLDGLRHQTLSTDMFEVLIVDDGSSDGSSDFAAAANLPFQNRVLVEKNRGASAARNQGASNASAEILLFLDADMVPSPDLVEEHLKSHFLQENILLVGNRKVWPPAQNGCFSKIIDVDSNVPEDMYVNNKVSFGQAFSSNLSIKSYEFWKIGGFDESLRRWHDIDFAYRAMQCGLHIQFNPNALAYHNHPMPFHEYCQKMYKHYKAAVIFFNKHPGMIDNFTYLTDKRPIHWGTDSLTLILRKIARRFIALRPVLFLTENLTAAMERRHVNNSLLRFLYWKIIASYELLGLRDGSKQYHVKF